MTEPRYDVIAIGNAIVDVMAPCTDDLIEELDAQIASGRITFAGITDFGRILIDLGSGPAEYGLISAELQDTPIQVWDLAGLATVHAADAAGTRLNALMYFRNDGRTDLVDARTTSPENQGEVMVRMQQNPEPHGVLSDGTTLNPFVWCGRD